MIQSLPSESQANCLKSSDDGQQEAQTIGLDLRDCANREFSIGVAAGAEKHAVVRACIRARYLNVSVTDEPRPGSFSKRRTGERFTKARSRMNVAETALHTRGPQPAPQPGRAARARLV